MNLLFSRRTAALCAATIGVIPLSASAATLIYEESAYTAFGIIADGTNDGFTAYTPILHAPQFSPYIGTLTGASAFAALDGNVDWSLQWEPLEHDYVDVGASGWLSMGVENTFLFNHSETGGFLDIYYPQPGALASGGNTGGLTQLSHEFTQPGMVVSDFIGNSNWTAQFFVEGSWAGPFEAVYAGHMKGEGDGLLRLTYTYTPIENFDPTGSSVDWHDTAQWDDDTPPTGSGAVAGLYNVGSATTISLDDPVTLGVLILDSSYSYTLAGPSTLTFQQPSGRGSAQVSVATGNHTISAPVHLATNTSFTISASNTLTLSGDLTGDADVKLSKGGAGKLVVNNLRIDHVTVGAGVLQVAANGGSAGTSKVETLHVLHGAKLDIRDNEFVVTDGELGTWVKTSSGAPEIPEEQEADPGEDTYGYNGLTGLVARGYNETLWDGNGITTSMTDAATGLTTLGIATAEQALLIGATETTVWSGQTVIGTDILIKYTWGGDVNLDGELNGDDYFILDSNSLLSGTIFGFGNGDVNYDGAIDGNDYTIIDANYTYASLSSPFSSASGAGGFAAVPEPALVGALVALPILGRRRRR